LLVAKIALVAVMAAIGALNRYRYVPAIQRDTGRPEPRTLFTLPRFLRSHHDSTAVMHFFRSLRVEMTLLLGVLLLAAALSQQTPASHAEHDTLQGHVHGDD
jgi:putative copper export protein